MDTSSESSRYVIMSLATLKLNDHMSVMDEQNIRDALNLAPESICNKWTMGQSQNKYRLYAPMCMECLVSPHSKHETTVSFIEVDGKMTKMRIYCDIHGERQIRGKSLDVLRRVFFGSPEKDEAETPHERLVHQLEYAALSKNLKRSPAEMMVYAPITGCPSAYERYMSFESFIQTTLKGDRDFRSNPNRFRDLETYMVKYNEDAFPQMVRDKNVLSFKNGILLLSTNTFVSYDSEQYVVNHKGTIARHHIPSDFDTKRDDTPLFDSIMDAQFDENDGRKEMMYAMIGRLFFEVTQLDNWQVMTLILGEAGTGKSTIFRIVEEMFNPLAIGEIDANLEKTFGLQDKATKEVMFIRDAPMKMSQILPQEQFQKMVTGEGIQISVKHKMAYTVNWRSHILAGANKCFDYEDNAGQISRRVAIFHFTKSLDQSQIDVNLASNIIKDELPIIIKKSLSTYIEYASSGKPFWAICPDSIKSARDDAMIVGNLVYRFLTAGPDENATRTMKTYVRNIQGKTTDWEAFKNAFEAYVRYKLPGKKWSINVRESGPFTKLGYTIARIKICRACLGPAHANCCENYSNGNRSTKYVIENMELVREEIQQGPYFDSSN